MKIMFDATILANAADKNSSRSGIFFTAYQIVLSLMKNKDVELSFYCAPYQQPLLEKIEEFRDIPVYPKITKFEQWLADLRHKKTFYKNSNKVLLKTLYHYLLFIAKCIFYIPNHIAKKRLSLPKIDVYFSPYKEIPSEINELPDLKKYILLHDVIPLVLPQYFKDMQEHSMCHPG